jgi:hypothetical protein
VIVGEIGNDLPRDGPDLLPIADRYRSDSEPPLQSSFVEHFGMGFPDRAYVRFGAREVVVDSGLGGHMVRADPHLAAGPCGCASDLVAGVEDNGSAPTKSDR